MATYWENSCSFGLRNVLWYKYLIVTLVFSHLGFWSGNLSLIAPFPDLCLLVPFYQISTTPIASTTISSILISDTVNFRRDWQEEWLQVKIFFDSLETVKHEQILRYTQEDIVGMPVQNAVYAEFHVKF